MKGDILTKLRKEKQLFFQNYIAGTSTASLRANVTERETKPHSAGRSNKEIVGRERLDSACLAVA